MTSDNRGWIGVDLDSCLAHYDGWKGADHIGPPIPAMVARVKQWLAEGKNVRIFTARVWCPPPGSTSNTKRRDEAMEAKGAIVRWCIDHIGVPLPVTCEKDYNMIELWDDRAIQVESNTGRPITERLSAESADFAFSAGLEMGTVREGARQEREFVDSLLDMTSSGQITVGEAKVLLADYRKRHP